MKRIYNYMLILTTFAVVSGGFTACENHDPGAIVPTYRDLVVSYQTNGGSAIDDYVVSEEGDFSPVPAPPVKSGYVFDGWFTDEALTEEFHPVTDRVYRDMVLYAKYISAEENELRFGFSPEINTLGGIKDEYKESIKYLTIPATVDGVPVHHVTDWMCYENENLLTLSVPEGVRSVGSYAFDFCSNLRTVTLPSTLETLGTRTFAYCTHLENIDLGGLKEFQQHTFNNCTKIKTLHVPGSCAVFPLQGFYQSRADEIILGEGTIVLADLAFHEANAGRIVVPASILAIGANAFAYVNYHIPGALIIEFKSTDPNSVSFDAGGSFLSVNPIIEVPAGAVAAYQNSPVWSALGFEIRAAQ